jgi:hypothetical protein
MLINIEILRQRNRPLYNLIVTRLGFEPIRIDSDDFPGDIQDKLHEWVHNQRPRTVAPVEEPTSEAPASPAPEPVTPQSVAPEEQIDLAAYQRAELQRATDEARGLARMEQYAVEQGLARSPENAAAIKEWLENNVKGYISAVGVDAAIQWLGPRGSNVLTWTPKSVVPPPVPQPIKVLGTLPNGESQLALDQPIPTNASREQARDYLKRTRERQPYVRPHGVFSSRFI